jgi:glycerophosphoryl diester phosphodiesterase
VTEPVQADAALAAAHRTTDEALSPGDAVVRLVAHRGSGHAHTDPLGPPENTLSAVEYGFSQGADAVEVDVWRTADGIVVLHHDATTDRTTDQPGWDITGATYAQLLALSAGSWKQDSWAGLGIPTLADCARAVPQGRGLVVEIEEGPQVVADVLSAITPAGLTPEEIMFISKNLDTAGEVKRQAPEHRVLWIVDTTPRWQIGGWTQGHRRGPHSARVGYDDATDCHWLVQQVLDRGLDGLDTLFAYPPDLPVAVSQAGLLWMVWTANDPRAVDLCLQDGAWGITTDNTAQVRSWLEASGRSTAHAAAQHF